MLRWVDCDAFVLIATMNSCPCEYVGDPRRAGSCAPAGDQPVSAARDHPAHESTPWVSSERAMTVAGGQTHGEPFC
jgi:hypothetical protein